ncbi:hypothetical protein TNCV_4350351 [Trichonephila clavipes]|nr:hypothetical protein TNCV_4350351 [Trichonephila clavipes]
MQLHFRLPPVWVCRRGIAPVVSAASMIRAFQPNMCNYCPINRTFISEIGPRITVVLALYGLGKDISQWPLHVFRPGSVAAVIYQDVILDPYAHLYMTTNCPDAMFMDNNSKVHTARIVN